MIHISLSAFLVYQKARLIASCLLTPESSSCNTAKITTDHTTRNWIDSVTDENGVYIGQDKEVVGYYKRVSIVKIGETYEDMLELHDIEKQG